MSSPAGELVRPETLEDYARLDAYLDDLKGKDRELWRTLVRVYGELDLYFFLRYVLSTSRWRHKKTKRQLVDHQWWLDGCRLIQDAPRDRMWEWPRETGKTTIITFAKTVWWVSRDPESVHLIVSCMAQMATIATRQIRAEMTSNETLKECWPHVYWSDPEREADLWSEDEFNVRRPYPRREATITASGFIKFLKTGGHYDRVCCDDLIHRDYAKTEEVRQNAESQFLLLQVLIADGGYSELLGTPYDERDLYSKMPEYGIFVEKRHAIDPTKPPPPGYYEKEMPGGYKRRVYYRELGGMPVYHTPDECCERLIKWTRRVFFQQYCLSASGGVGKLLDPNHLVTYRKSPDDQSRGALIYICGDLARGLDKGSHDPTVFTVWGATEDEELLLLDGIVDWLNPHERIHAFLALVDRWRPIEDARIEATDDFEFHLSAEAGRRGVRLPPLHMVPHRVEAKEDRIYDWSSPVLERRALWVPPSIPFRQKSGDEVDVVDLLRAEMADFPARKASDHILDSFANLSRRVLGDGTERAPAVRYPSRERPIERPRRRSDRWLRGPSMAPKAASLGKGEGRISKRAHAW